MNCKKIKNIKKLIVILAVAVAIATGFWTGMGIGFEAAGNVEAQE